MNKRTIRELGGEVWAEISTRRAHGHIKLKNLQQEALDEIIDLFMGILTRHKDTRMEDDEDLPVTLLPPYGSTL